MADSTNGQRPISYRDIVRTLRNLGLSGGRVLVHANSTALQGTGLPLSAILGALMSETELLIMPGFTLQTMVMPLVGPADNGMQYSEDNDNSMAEFWRADLPVHTSLGALPELFRCSAPTVQTSLHPLLRFLAHGKGAAAALRTQTMNEPLAPIQWLAENDGHVLLLGANAADNLSLHVANQMVGGQRYVRWALARDRVVEVGNYLGPTGQFSALSEHIQMLVNSEMLGDIAVESIPLADMLKHAQSALQ